MTRLVLTIPQARNLQRSNEWPGCWHFLVAIDTPDKPDVIADPDRMAAALQMKTLGCEDDQIAEQLGWKNPSAPLRQLARIHKRGTKPAPSL